MDLSTVGASAPGSCRFMFLEQAVKATATRIEREIEYHKALGALIRRYRYDCHGGGGTPALSKIIPL